MLKKLNIFPVRLLLLAAAYFVRLLVIQYNVGIIKSVKSMLFALNYSSKIDDMKKQTVDRIFAEYGKIADFDPPIFKFNEILEEKFSLEVKTKGLQIIPANITKFEPAKYGLKSGNYKIVANIPYYLTGEIIRQFLSGKTKPNELVLLIQREVAKRIVARAGAMGQLTSVVRGERNLPAKQTDV